MTEPTDAAAVALSAARLELGGRVLWNDLDLRLRPGELLAVLGPNGAGKSSLLRVLLGQLPTAGGSALILGGRPGRHGSKIGYIPQQKLFDRGTRIRARDLVGLGFDGHRFGVPLPRAGRKDAIRAALDRVGAAHYADAPVGVLSGGEQQRLRIAQALVSQPDLLLCDEPLLSLDLGHQRAVLDAIDGYRRDSAAAVVLVTHDVNPLRRMVDRVLYVAPGGHRVGAPDEVLTGDVLSELYGVHVDVIDVHGRVVIVPSDESTDHHGPALPGDEVPR